MAESTESMAGSADDEVSPSENVAEPTENVTEPSQNNNRSRRRAIRLGLLIGAAFIVGFIIFGVIAITVWDYSNSVHFCAQACHDVHPEEIAAFEDSYHANIKCTECHMGRVGTINNIFLKASHFRHLPEVVFDAYDRPLESETMRPANESCELCHWPPAFHGDTVREITHFEPDEENTRKNTYLILKTGSGSREEGMGYGIHWHIANPVEYIAADESNEDILWIRTTLPDGRTVEYNDILNPLSPEEIEDSHKKLMDCVDCHNRVGHPFPSPGDLTDQALEDGDLSTDLPYSKREMADLLSATHDSQEEALEAVGDVRERYEAEYPETAVQMPGEIEEADQLAQELLQRLVFEEPGVSWRDFEDHSGHDEFAGCFRCHDGEHVSSDGESIRLHCNICHSIPQTVGPNERPPQMPVTSVEEPPSHLESNFMADHRFLASDECAGCHGEIEFGADDSSFCANSSCHGRAWPEVELDAAFPHPIELEGQHAEVWCHDCHEGVAQPEYVCANCHEPPMEPHFGDVCEDCHTPQGWEQAELVDFEHPIPLEGAHAEASCSDCHAEDRELTGSCADCHEPPSEPHFGPSCEECHTATSFADASLPAEMHPVALEGAHATAACADCHVEGQETPEFVCSNCHEPPANHLTGECDTCHTPEGFAESASFLVSAAPEVSHELEGREDCFMCHDSEGQIRPAPSNHAEYENEQCIVCHTVQE